MNAKYYVLNTAQYGRAVFAQTDLNANEVVMYCEILVLNSADTFLVNLTDLKHYTFVYRRGEYSHMNQDCLVLGDGEIFNHDDNANVSYELINLNGRDMMRFVTTKPVKRDEQLFIDYNADVPDSEKKENVLDSYNVNMI